ncbi:MAG: glycerophosphodiester phosphodiesterase [Cytophagales bacterium]|nr:glycerophosphodiester phosphodiesterase [Bernardetiaceae bacterium]MDW8203445.1 glycerophosphodiester phosphodiesterase [Cytophagales bacterium]
MKRLMLSLLVVTVLPLFTQCQSPDMQKPREQFDLQGHRGARGLVPENTIPSMLKALDCGVNTLELDVVISKDKKVVVSHEPFLNYKICKNPEGKPITEAEGRSYNLYQMNYDSIARCDCGSMGNPDFPEQQKMTAFKPLLADLIDATEKYAREKGLQPPRYNIETKLEPTTDNIYHPEPQEFMSLVYQVVKEKGIAERTCIQSFDVRTLQALHKMDSNITVALLVAKNPFYENAIKELGFKPDVYSPYHLLVTSSLIEYGQREGIKIIPWTVNDFDTMQKLAKMGVDGIITDYPNRAQGLFEQK